MLIRLAVILLLTFCFCNGVVTLKMEINALRAARVGMQLQVQSTVRNLENSSSAGSFEICDETTSLLRNDHKHANGVTAGTLTAVADDVEAD